MATYLVTRHPGAVDWAHARGFGDAQIAAHFDPAVVAPGDVVIGTLPINLVADVCGRGGSYQHLVMEIPPDMRGRDLSAADMEACGARLEGFTAGRAA